MKKNGIDAFEGMDLAMNKISGGFYTYDTQEASGTDDCQQVTERGDTYNGETNNDSYNWQDEYTRYELVDPNPGGGGVIPPGRN